MSTPPILFEDAYLLVVVKPPGVPVQPDKTGDMDMTAMLPAGCKVVHRLDRTVGGVMVFAKTEAAAATLSASFAGDSVVKTYLAVAMGAIPPTGTLTEWLLKNERMNISKVVPCNTPRAKKAVLSYERYAVAETEDGALSLVRIILQTGRHHQIRVQLAHAGTPLWGDTKYNPNFARRRNVFPALWAERLTFPHPVTGRKMAFTCPPPEVIPFTWFA